MRRSEVLEILSEHRQEIAGFEVKSLAIFGSVARDEAGPESDVDILVEFYPEAHVGMFGFLELKDYLEGVLGYRVDLVSKGAIKRRLSRADLRGGYHCRLRETGRFASRTSLKPSPG